MIDEQCQDEYMGLSYVVYYLDNAHKAAVYLLGESETLG